MRPRLTRTHSNLSRSNVSKRTRTFPFVQHFVSLSLVSNPLTGPGIPLPPLQKEKLNPDQISALSKLDGMDFTVKELEEVKRAVEVRPLCPSSRFAL